ncbi:hypothetical protein [Lysobacter gummosus]
MHRCSPPARARNPRRLSRHAPRVAQAGIVRAKHTPLMSGS